MSASWANISGRASMPKGPQDPPWLYLLDPMNRGWREKRILKGENPDPYIEDQLRRAGAWPANDQVSGENA
jgi:hypothetical protein